MGKKISRSLPLVLLVLFFVSTSASAFFKCKDRHGQWHFSDTTAGIPESCLKRNDEIPQKEISKKSDIEKEKIEKLAKEKARAIVLEKEAEAYKENKKREKESQARKDVRDKARKLAKASTLAKARLRLAQARVGAMQNGENQELNSTTAMVMMAVTAVFAILFMAGIWKTFTKAGQPGWAILIPIYNFLILLKIAGKPWWWVVLLLIPVVNLIILILLYIEIAKRFGKSVLFAFGLLFLGIIFFPILGFGKAEYKA